MSTRFATVADIPRVVELLAEFGSHAQRGYRPAASQDQSRLLSLVTAWQQRHYIKVAVDHNQVVGMIIAELGQDFWDPTVNIMQERAWYVKHSKRASRVSAQLWQEFDRDTSEYIQSGRIASVLLSTQGPSTNFDPSRRGWRLIEQIWIKEK
jgi:hypothetical protein